MIVFLRPSTKADNGHSSRDSSQRASRQPKTSTIRVIMATPSSLPPGQQVPPIGTGGTTSSTPNQPPSTSTSTSPPPTTSTTPSSTPPTSSTPAPPSSSSAPPSSSSPPPPPSSSTPPPQSTPETTPPQTVPSSTTTSTKQVTFTSSPTVSSSITSSAKPTPTDGSSGDGGGLNDKGKVAVGVVVPIVAIAILAVLGLWWWRKRKARLEEEAERRKEVEDYSYNPNNDPTIPAVGVASDGAYEMRSDGSAGYRGWGSTVAGSMGRKASTTMSGGAAAGAFSDGTGPSRSVAGEGAYAAEHSSQEGEILGAMGPSAANNPSNVRRGPSNASSSYSVGGRSEGSDTYNGPAGAYYDQYGQGPYAENGAQAGAGQAIIRDNPARRNTQIENSAHYPQQSAGIAQNF